MAKRMQSQKHASVLKFFRKTKRVMMFDKVLKTAIREPFSIK